MSDETQQNGDEESEDVFASFPRNPVVQIRFGPRRFGTRFGQTSDDIIERVHAPSQSEMARVVKRDLKRYYDLLNWCMPETSLDVAMLLYRLRERSATSPSVDDLNDWEEQFDQMIEQDRKTVPTELPQLSMQAATLARKWLRELTLVELVATLDALERAVAYVRVEKMSIPDALRASGILGEIDNAEADA